VPGEVAEAGFLLTLSTGGLATRAAASFSPRGTALSTARTSGGARTVAPASSAWNVAPSIAASRVKVSSPEARNPPREGRFHLAPRRRPMTWPWVFSEAFGPEFETHRGHYSVMRR